MRDDAKLVGSRSVMLAHVDKRIRREAAAPQTWSMGVNTGVGSLFVAILEEWGEGRNWLGMLMGGAGCFRKAGNSGFVVATWPLL